ncbi:MULTISPECIES: CorA family divalent cation transporter [Methylobacterium]|jgi:magnesium transporter|uniref:Magnesium transport protein CorA n=2 Tax=Methylobacterium TaxID=407 RepID=A0AAE8HRE6_9HYPH|nr:MULTISPECIES: CorA family divalent cation transporter [Methylobacterium]KOX51674.1 magnesium transporter CorA [Streptomyces purpurogeneiscleroticus]APT29405.1 magnesium transport protein CorA [Methylobacterium phyllosphaerae]AWV18962.1 magnesium transporter CorA [Methylobacterium sp. XJLW]MBA9062982.1 magnesium transporter [Methylobacterium fujisawaense]MBP32792.1 magnesium transporter CorA [Methylobacterium sp.]
MLSLHGPEGPVALQPGSPIARHTVWLDLNDPSPEEAKAVEAATGLRVPSRAALSEVETSSRLRRVKGGLSLSTPMITFEQSASQVKPLGFLLTKDHFVTIRFHDLRAFDSSAKRIAEGDGSTTPSEIFLVVLEELVDSLADALEDMGSELDTLSTRIFDFDVRGAERRRLESPPPRRRDLALRRILRGISNRGKVLGKIRASLLGLERIVPFVAAACDGIGLPEDARFETIKRDIESLDEFETRLAENVQFLLDAALGLITIEQNNVFRVLTVVSVVGVPPTLIASIYGMNFKHMPELDWTLGYPYALGLILFSAIAPIVYFRMRGWF